MSADELDLSKVKAGDYELLVHSWDEIVSKPGTPYDFVPHRQGDIVTLDVEQARRLLTAGAVKPKGANSGNTPPADNKPTSVKDILKDVGADKAKAQEYLDAETAKGDDARGSLVDGLQKVIAAEQA